MEEPDIVLVVDDDQGVRTTFRAALELAGLQAVTAGSGLEALAVLAARPVRVVLLDANLPDLTGEEVLDRIRAEPSTATVPVVMVTGDGTVHRRVEGLTRGANDYLVKPVSADELVARVRAQLRVHEDWVARIDAALGERRTLARALGGLDTTLDVHDLVVGIHTVAGPALGGRQLVVTPVVDAGVGPVLARSGDGAGIPDLADQVRRALSGPLVVRSRGSAYVHVVVEAHARPLAVVSVETEHDPGPVLTTLLDLSPQIGMLLHRAVEREVESSRTRVEIEELARARGLRPVFQPAVDLITGTVVGFEGLSRFPDGVGAESWFRNATRLGLRAELEMAAVEVQLQAANGLPPGPWLALNVSVETLVSGRLGSLLAGVERPLLLELTEHELVRDYDAVVQAIDGLDGVGLSVDDTGAGYASLRHVFELRPEVVKLDRAWISGIDGDLARQALVSGLVRFTEQLGAVLLAEGVERHEERDVLRGLGVPLGQGFLFGAPVPVEA